MPPPANSPGAPRELTPERERRFLLLALGLGALLAAALVEVALRVLLSGALPGPTETLAPYVGHFYEGDDQYRLQLRARFKGRERQPTFDRFDPALGWTARPRTPENPLGILAERPYTVAELRSGRRALFFGDSFTAGFTELRDAIPQRLDQALEDLAVLNFGVPGYGLDQMYLAFRSVVDLFDRPHVIVGVFYNDIDRVINRVRESVKPYFEIGGGALVERGTPIPADPERWLEAFPPPGRLYVWAAAGGLFRLAVSIRRMPEYLFALHPSEAAGRREEKMALVRLIVEAFKAECDRRGLALTFVLFPYREHLVHQGWYEVFMRGLLDEKHIDYVDLKPPLQERVRTRGLRWWRDVYTLSQHPNAEENRLMVDHLAGFLRRRHGYR